MTLYLPQPALSDQEYLDVLDDASRLLELFVPPGEPIVISVDGNCRLGQPASDLEWRYLGDALRQVRNQRGQFLLNFIIKHDLLVADSFFPHGSLPTRHGWTASSYEDEAEHMDFFLVSRDVIIKNYLIKMCDATITDHSMLMLTIEFRRRFKQWHAPKPIGWQCADASVFFDQCSSGLNASQTIAEASSVIAAAGAASASSPDVSNKQQKRINRQHLRELQHQWRQSASPSEQHNIGRLIQKERTNINRREKGDKIKSIINNPGQGGWGKKSLDANTMYRCQLHNPVTDEDVVDELEVSMAMETFYTNQFLDEDDDLPAYVFQIPDVPIVVDAEEYLNACMTCPSKKSCANDMLVGEHLSTLASFRAIPSPNFIVPVQTSSETQGPGKYGDGVYLIQCDGGRREGKLDRPERQGCGWAVYTPEGELLWTDFHAMYQGWANDSEWHGLILALDTCVQLGLQSVAIESDNAAVVNQLLGFWRTYSVAAAGYRRAAWKVLEHFKHVQARWIPRNLNVVADMLANQAMDQGPNYITWTSFEHKCTCCLHNCEVQPWAFLDDEDMELIADEQNQQLQHPIRTLTAAFNFELAGGQLVDPPNGSIEDGDSLMTLATRKVLRDDDVLEVDMTLLNKEAIIRWFNQMRPISLLPV